MAACTSRVARRDGNRHLHRREVLRVRREPKLTSSSLLRRYWPGFVLGLLSVVGSAVYGVSGAVMTPIIGMLIVGPGYLIHQRVRRRRGTAAQSGRRLGRDADHVFGALARRYLASKRAHPVRWEAIDLVYGAATVAVVWILLGSTVGFVFAVFWGVFILLGLVILVARFRFRPPGQT